MWAPLLGALLTLGLSAPGAAQEAESSAPVADVLPPGQVRAIENVIENYLVENPEIISRVIDRLRERRQDAEAERTRASILANADELFRDPMAPVGGNPEGDVTIVEFFDYRCGYCKQVADQLAELLDEDGQLRFVYKEFPILGEESVLAARAALAANNQGRYTEFHAALMALKNGLSKEVVMTLAAGIGIDTERLAADMAAPEIEDAIQRGYALADAIGVNGTPAFVIGDIVIPGAVDMDTLRKLVAQARQG